MLKIDKITDKFGPIGNVELLNSFPDFGSIYIIRRIHYRIPHPISDHFLTLSNTNLFHYRVPYASHLPSSLQKKKISTRK